MACHGTERSYFSDVCLIHFSKNRENLCHKQCYICLAFPAIYECVPHAHRLHTHIHTPSPYSTKKSRTLNSNIFQANIHFFRVGVCTSANCTLRRRKIKLRRENTKAIFIWMSPTKPFNCIYFIGSINRSFSRSMVGLTGYLYVSPKRAITFRLAGAQYNTGNSNTCCICYCLNWT